MKCLSILLLLFSCGCVHQVKKGGMQFSGGNIENVIIVVMDSVRYDDTFGKSNHIYIDNIWNNLKKYGTIQTELYNNSITLPVAAHMSLFTGRYQAFADPEENKTRSSYPTLFEYYLKARNLNRDSCYFVSSQPDLEIASFSSSRQYGEKYAPTFFSNRNETSRENAVYENFIPVLEEKHPSFVVLSLTSGKPIGQHLSADECVTKGTKDACGGSDALNAYYESIILMDSVVFDLYNRIESDSHYKDKTLFVVVSDHGRHTNDYSSFGDNCKGCSHLISLFIGPGIKKNYISGRKRNLIDVCSTVCEMLNLPNESNGKVMSEIFEP